MSKINKINRKHSPSSVRKMVSFFLARLFNPKLSCIGGKNEKFKPNLKIYTNMTKSRKFSYSNIYVTSNDKIYGYYSDTLPDLKLFYDWILYNANDKLARLSRYSFTSFVLFLCLVSSYCSVSLCAPKLFDPFRCQCRANWMFFHLGLNEIAGMNLTVRYTNGWN